jgi:acyl-CoA reductase-like NAD-dependent aldehyde dehydrogenase
MAPVIPSVIDPVTTSGLIHPERLAALRAVEELLIRDRAQVMSVLTEVATYQASEYEVEAARLTLAGAVREVETYRPGPVTELAVFMPSNVILYSYVLYLLVPALFADRIRFRPSSKVHDQLRKLHDLLAPVHQLPVELVDSSQRAFIQDVVQPAQVVVFTGTYQNAEQIRSLLTPEHLLLYLGSGVNPFVVTPDADLDKAVRDAVEIRLLNSGQDCLAPDLFIVHESRRDEFVAGLIERLRPLRFGPTNDPTADYGPMVYSSALAEAANYLLRYQPHIVHGGHLNLSERRVEPTVIVLDQLDNKLAGTELFAPIFTVTSYQDEDKLASQLTSGGFVERAMGASVYGHAPRLVTALARRHMVTVNQTLLSLDDGNTPFGGRGPMANYVAHGGRVHPEPILVSKAVADHLTGKEVRP